MYYFTIGKIPPKRHTQFRQPDGSLYHEELMGTRGFSGRKALLYHLRPPTQVHGIEEMGGGRAAVRRAGSPAAPAAADRRAPTKRRRHLGSCAAPGQR